MRRHRGFSELPDGLTAEPQHHRGFHDGATLLLMTRTSGELPYEGLKISGVL